MRGAGMSTARPADLTITRDLLCAMLSESGRVLLTAENVRGAMGIDSKALRCLGDRGQISFVAKGEKARGFPVEAVLDFIAEGGIKGQATDQPVNGSIDTTSNCEVVAFTARKGAPQKRQLRPLSAKSRPRRGPA